MRKWIPGIYGLVLELEHPSSLGAVEEKTASDCCGRFPGVLFTCFQEDGPLEVTCHVLGIRLPVSLGYVYGE